MSTDVLAVLAALRAERDSMLNPLDIPGSWTPRQKEAYEYTRAVLRARISTIEMALPELDKVNPKIAAEQDWLAKLHGWRRPLADEFLALPKRDVRQDNYRLSITCIDRGVQYIVGSGYGLETLRLGELMRQSGYQELPPDPGRVWGTLPWFGSIPECEYRLRELTKRRDDAQMRIDGVLRDVAREAVNS